MERVRVGVRGARAKLSAAGLRPLALALAAIALLLVMVAAGRAGTSGEGRRRRLLEAPLACEDLREEVAMLRAQAAVLLELRLAYGDMHCKVHGIGPTGGFCLNTSQPTASGSLLDESLCAALASARLFSGGSLLDLGCGRGQYGRCLTAADPRIAWTGYDGSEGVERATDGYVKFMDLAMPQYLPQRYDWVMALEVGEHLPSLYEPTFLDNVARHAKTGVVLSWAVPGQPGHFHVNLRENRYVISRMAERGFSHDNSTSQALRSAASFAWFKGTLMVFRRGAASHATMR